MFFFCKMFAAKISYVNVSWSDSHYFCTAYNMRFESVFTDTSD